MDERIREIQGLLDKQSLCTGSVIKVQSVADNKVIVRMLGTCSGCPSAQLTVKESVETAIIKEYPFVEEVILDTSVSDDLLSFAKKLLMN
ncbi:NifU family protein [Ruminococcus sp. OA3]|uniref:NifU family protein n=1 Tax=Ruminococcus sp. OA3 TaxID=2914164 RepID=UPI001F065D07|nr:NifU family protein [Ruminococcus sp. OA3]MCH1982273.1 NifU family protein [Ruminococcus sp. OA3]